MKLREAALELQKENLQLRAENKALREQQQVSANLVFSEGVYWRNKDGDRAGPFCQKCYDDAGKLIRLQNDAQFSGLGRWICLRCEQIYS